MSESGERDDKKREYNRQAQKEFRARRKELLKEQSEELEKLRAENQSLRGQLYGPTIPNPTGFTPTTSAVPSQPYLTTYQSSSGSSSGNVSLSPVAQNYGSSSDASQQMVVVVAYGTTKARDVIRGLFQSLFFDPAILANPQTHLAALIALAPQLPPSLRPTKTQAETAHHYSIDLIPSPTLRDALLAVGTDVSNGFLTDFGSVLGVAEDRGQVTIWGEDPLNEMSWELSEVILTRWNWLLGSTWTSRANFWRRQRGATTLPEW